MKNESIKLLILLFAGMLFLTSFNLISNKNCYYPEMNSNFSRQKITPDDIIKVFDSFFLIDELKKNYNSCTVIKSDVKKLHELFIEEYPELKRKNISFDVCIKANENEYYHFDYSRCNLIKKEAIPEHIIHVFDGIKACMGLSYWSDTKRTKYRSRTFKIYKDLDYPIYIEMWYN